MTNRTVVLKRVILHTNLMPFLPHYSILAISWIWPLFIWDSDLILLLSSSPTLTLIYPVHIGSKFPGRISKWSFSPSSGSRFFDDCSSAANSSQKDGALLSCRPSTARNYYSSSMSLGDLSPSSLPSCVVRTHRAWVLGDKLNHINI